MLEKKEMIQKSFRIDRKLDLALSELSGILNRSQNELIDHAIRLLIRENIDWFTEGFVKEFYHEIVNELYEPNEFEINEYKLCFIPHNHIDDKGAYLALNEIKNRENIEIYKSIVGNDPGTHERIKKSLRDIALIVMKRYPELKNRYGISDVDVEV